MQCDAICRSVYGPRELKISAQNAPHTYLVQRLTSPLCVSLAIEAERTVKTFLCLSPSSMANWWYPLAKSSVEKLRAPPKA